MEKQAFIDRIKKEIEQDSFVAINAWSCDEWDTVFCIVKTSPTDLKSWVDKYTPLLEQDPNLRSVNLAWYSVGVRFFSVSKEEMISTDIHQVEVAVDGLILSGCYKFAGGEINCELSLMEIEEAMFTPVYISDEGYFDEAEESSL